MDRTHPWHVLEHWNWRRNLEQWALYQWKGFSVLSLGFDEDFGDVYRSLYPPTLSSPVDDILRVFMVGHPPFNTLMELLACGDRFLVSERRVHWFDGDHIGVISGTPNLIQLLSLRCVCRGFRLAVEDALMLWMGRNMLRYPYPRSHYRAVFPLSDATVFVGVFWRVYSTVASAIASR